MKHLEKFGSFNEGRLSKVVGATGIALAASIGSAKEKTKAKEQNTEYVVPVGRKDIIESYQSLLSKEGIEFEKISKFKNLKDVQDYINYLDELCEKNDIVVLDSKHSRRYTLTGEIQGESGPINNSHIFNHSIHLKKVNDEFSTFIVKLSNLSTGSSKFYTYINKIDIIDLPNGTYLMEILDDNGFLMSKKVIIQH